MVALAIGCSHYTLWGTPVPTRGPSYGEIYPVTVRGIGHMNAPVSDLWQPGDFLVRVDGIDIERVKEMRQLVQDIVPDMEKMQCSVQEEKQRVPL